jgi:hypothetical protein
MQRTLRLLLALLAAVGLDVAAEPQPCFAAVVHRSNPAHELRRSELLALFEGDRPHWPRGAAVVLVERDSGSAPFRYLMRRLLNTTPGEYKRRLQNIEYRGEAPVPIKVLNSDEAACEFVFNVPAAIAIIEAQSLASPACREVRELRIDGKLPSEQGYTLK